MAAQSTINVRVDSEIKSQANDILNCLGLDMSTAINVYLRQIVSCHGLPFPVTQRFNAETEQAIREAHQGINLSGPYDSVDALMEALDAED
jgi:DNA-damage-inducible protein J